MKSYLLLQDGTTFSQNSISAKFNVLGELVKLENQIGIKCKTTGSFFKAELDEYALQMLNNKLCSQNGFLGKFIVDELPIDYHIYDLKTTI